MSLVESVAPDDCWILADTVIDGTGAPPLTETAVRIQGGVIREIRPRARLGQTDREQAAVLDCGDATLLPGLIDPHCHLTFNAAATHAEVRAELESASSAALAIRAVANAEAHLRGGVTTLRDVGCPGRISLDLRDAVGAGLLLAPRILASGPPITPPRGHLHYLGCLATTADEVRRRAEENLDAGADLVKVCATGGIMTAESDPMECHYGVEELRAAVVVAAGRGKLVAAHALAAEGVRRCIAAGVRSIEHCVWQDAPGEYSYPPDQGEEMRRRGIVAGLTYAGLSQVRYRESVLGERSGEDMGAWRGRMEQRYVSEREMIDAGVRYVLHSDAGVRGTRFGEFWIILASACFELGITPLEAIHAVTGSAASLLGVGAITGTLTPGLAADLLLVPGNAARRVEVLATPLIVWLGGRRLSHLPGHVPHGRTSLV